MTKAKMVRKVVPIAYLIQNEIWDQLPNVTQNLITKRIKAAFFNLLQIKIVSEDNLPKAINLVDSIIYLWNQNTNQIEGLFKNQSKIAGAKSDIPNIDIAAAKSIGEDKGCAIMYKKECKDLQGTPARVSITVGGIYTQLIINDYQGPQPHFPMKELKNQDTYTQKRYGIIFGNYISHEIRHQYMGDGHADEGLGSVGSGIAKGKGTEYPTSFNIAATEESFSFSKKDFKMIKNEINEYRKLDQQIKLKAIETR